MTHPRDVLLGTTVSAQLPVHDRFCVFDVRMVKSLGLQAELAKELGNCICDVTLDRENGAPAGDKKNHEMMVLALSKYSKITTNSIAESVDSRVAVRVHPVDNPMFEQDVDLTLDGAGASECRLMIYKVESVVDIDRAKRMVDSALRVPQRSHPLPLQASIDSPMAAPPVAASVTQPGVRSLIFGLLDLVFSRGGAIPSGAMGSTRLSSIFTDQIRPILASFAAAARGVASARPIVCGAHAAGRALVPAGSQLPDRASGSYFWQVLEKAPPTARSHRDEPVQGFFLPSLRFFIVHKSHSI